MTQATLSLANAAPPPPPDRRAALALALADGIGPVRHRRFSAVDGGASAALERRLTAAARADAYAAADRATEAAARCGATLVLVGEAGYPVALLDLPDPPPAIWLLGAGALVVDDRPRVAIVGTRDATPYGDRSAAALGRTLAGAGVVVVSGMARGIDAAAHTATLDAGGATVAVLGCGVDVAYPRGHRALHRRIAGEGLVLAERPPGTPPDAGAFPRRNRLIAALSRATIVVEAGTRSGALITAGVALELGRDVGAVPGPIDAAQAAGSNALLRDGAAVIVDASDALALAGIAAAHPAPTREPEGLADDELALWRALRTPAVDLDALCAASALPVRRCLAALGVLEATGHARQELDGTIVRV